MGTTSLEEAPQARSKNVLQDKRRRHDPQSAPPAMKIAKSNTENVTRLREGAREGHFPSLLVTRASNNEGWNQFKKVTRNARRRRGKMCACLYIYIYIYM